MTEKVGHPPDPLSPTTESAGGGNATDGRTSWHFISLRALELGQSLRLVWSTLSRLGVNLLSVGAFLGVVALLVHSLTHRAITIQPISVPGVLAESGYSADVASLRLRDALVQYQTAAHSNMPGAEFDLRGDLPDITVPAVGLTLDTIASYIQTFLHLSARRNISGDLTLTDRKLWLRLRLNGVAFYASPAGVDPSEPDALFARAAESVFEQTQPYFVVSTQAQSDVDRALATAERIIRERPASDENATWSYALEGAIYYRRQSYAKAEEAIAKSLARAPNLATAHNTLGIIHYVQGRHQEAMAEYRRAMQLDPRLAVAHINLANALREEGKSEEAATEYRKAAEIDPTDARTHSSLADFLREHGNRDDAIAEYRVTIEIAPSLARPHRDLALIFLAENNYEEATREVDWALKIDPKYADALVTRGDILRRQGKSKEALAEYHRAIEFAPATAHNALATMFLEDGNDEEATTEARQVLDIDPRNPIARGTYAHVLGRQGKREEAVAETRKGVELSPASAVAHRNLGMALRDLGHIDEAIAELHTAIALDPRNVEAHTVLNALQAEPMERRADRTLNQ